jgi:DnaJ-class molecular chaperone
MEVIDYYYKILDIKYSSTNDEIREAYKTKIDKYLHLPFLNDTQKHEIKELKKAQYILLNKNLRQKYDEIINNNLKEKTKMQEQEKKFTKKEKVDSSLVGDRVFSMIGIINAPQRNFDFDRFPINNE